MRGLEVTKVIHVKVTLTADQWELFTSIDALKPACEEAAREINSTIEEAVNRGLPRNEVYSAAYRTMKAYSKLGALDSEPLWMLEDLLGAIFGG